MALGGRQSAGSRHGPVGSRPGRGRSAAGLPTVMELAGLEPATSWVRSRISAFAERHALPRKVLICRGLVVLSALGDSDRTRPDLHGRVAYGLHGLVASQCNDQEYCRAAAAPSPSLRVLIECR